MGIRGLHGSLEDRAGLLEESRGELRARSVPVVGRIWVLIAARADIYSHGMARVDLTEQNGYLTPTLKVKRALIHQDFAAEIGELYR